MPAGLVCLILCEATLIATPSDKRKVAPKLTDPFNNIVPNKIHTRLGNELDQLVPTIIEMDLGIVEIEFDKEPDGALRVIGHSCTLFVMRHHARLDASALNRTLVIIVVLHGFIVVPVMANTSPSATIRGIFHIQR